MNEKLAEQASVALGAMIENATSLKDFVVAEAPDVIQQLLRWNFTISLIRFSSSVAIAVAWIVMVAIAYKIVKKRNNNKMDGELIGIFCVVNVFLAVVPLISCITLFNLTWLQIHMAPKLYLVEYAARFLR